MSASHALGWPADQGYVERYRVPDLMPSKISKTRAVFIGESPHRYEVESEKRELRSPFRGVAGREWWTELAKFLKRPPQTKPVPSRAVLEEICDELGIVVMNAIQFPLDEKITLHEGDAARPSYYLGFNKCTAPTHYRSVLGRGGRPNPVVSAIEDLATRLEPLVGAKEWICLGGDSRWFVERAISQAGISREVGQIPHPSAWWRKAAYRERAVKKLRELLGSARGTVPRTSERLPSARFRAQGGS